MIPVYQTRTVANNGTGDCHNACIASLLEIPLRDVADISPTNVDTWRSEWKTWLRSKGYDIQFFVHTTRRDPPRGYSIASVFTDRVYPLGHAQEGKPIAHSVIMYDGQLRMIL